MNSILIESFKNTCSGRLKQLIERCYLLLERHTQAYNPSDSYLICGIYTPSEIKAELRSYQDKLDNIGKQLEIDWVYLISIDKNDLSFWREAALVQNTLEVRKFYLELQFILSS